MKVTAPPQVAVFGTIYLHWLHAAEVHILTGAAFRTWVALLTTAAGKQSSTAYLSQLNAATGLADTALRKAFRELEAAGLIARQRSAGWGAPGRRSNGYTLLSPPSCRQAETEAGKALYSKPEQVESSTQGAAHTSTQGAAHTSTQGAAHTSTQGAAHTSTQGAAIHDLSQGSHSRSTHTERLAQDVARVCARCGAPPGKACAEKCRNPLLAGKGIDPDAQKTAKRLVCEWLQYVKRAPRSPWPSEVKYALELLDHDGEERAFNLVRAASIQLETSGALQKTYSFCGLRSVIVTPYKMIGGSIVLD